jgi:superoxide dismutase
MAIALPNLPYAKNAFYIDYRNARPKYLEAFWALVNWEFAAANFARITRYTT